VDNHYFLAFISSSTTYVPKQSPLLFCLLKVIWMELYCLVCVCYHLLKIERHPLLCIAAVDSWTVFHCMVICTNFVVYRHLNCFHSLAIWTGIQGMFKDMCPGKHMCFSLGYVRERERERERERKRERECVCVCVCMRE
jgi:hypothetical protein